MTIFDMDDLPYIVGGIIILTIIIVIIYYTYSYLSGSSKNKNDNEDKYRLAFDFLKNFDGNNFDDDFYEEALANHNNFIEGNNIENFNLLDKIKKTNFNNIIKPVTNVVKPDAVNTSVNRSTSLVNNGVPNGLNNRIPGFINMVPNGLNNRIPGFINMVPNGLNNRIPGTNIPNIPVPNNPIPNIPVPNNPNIPNNPVSNANIPNTINSQNLGINNPINVPRMNIMKMQSKIQEIVNKNIQQTRNNIIPVPIINNVDQEISTPVVTSVDTEKNDENTEENNDIENNDNAEENNDNTEENNDNTEENNDNAEENNDNAEENNVEIKQTNKVNNTKVSNSVEIKKYLTTIYHPLDLMIGLMLNQTNYIQSITPESKRKAEISRLIKILTSIGFDEFEQEVIKKANTEDFTQYVNEYKTFYVTKDSKGIYI